MRGRNLHKIINFSLLGILLTLIYSMFSIKTSYQDLNFQFTQLKKNLKYESNQINTLKAEIAFLSSPERLKTLAAKYTDLEDIQIVQIDDNGIFSQEEKLLAKNLYENNYKNKRKASKWRFKNQSSHSVRTVSVDN